MFSYHVSNAFPERPYDDTCNLFSTRSKKKFGDVSLQLQKFKIICILFWELFKLAFLSNGEGTSFVFVAGFFLSPAF